MTSYHSVPMKGPQHLTNPKVCYDITSQRVHEMATAPDQS